MATFILNVLWYVFPELLGFAWSFFLSVLASVLAAFLVGAIWWYRISMAADRYCGKWFPYDLQNRTLVEFPAKSVANIRRVSRLFPDELSYEGSYDGSASEGRVYMRGTISINPVAFNQATLTFQRQGNLKEYAVQQYFLMPNGDIFVVPAAADSLNKHVLLRNPLPRPEQAGEQVNPSGAIRSEPASVHNPGS